MSTSPGHLKSCADPSRPITQPTLVVRAGRARRNLLRMLEKAQRAGVRLRPHFKTHQSPDIGEWFRQSGVSAITVSSLGMAADFADHGWQDILVAFPANPRQADEIRALAGRIQLGLLIENLAALDAVGRLSAPLDIWIEVDDGSGRTGISWQRPADVFALAWRVQDYPHLRLRGLLTHAGRCYRAGSPDEIRQVYIETLGRMRQARHYLFEHHLQMLEISVGDTPGCTLSPDLGPQGGRPDEIRPGNFIFYDLQQLALGVCAENEIALAVACPVIALHPERGEAVLYGGAVHFSLDRVVSSPWFERGETVYGLLALETPEGWGDHIPGGRLARLSQEHGVAILPPHVLSSLHIGDLLYVLPAHSCLAVSALPEYRIIE